MVCDGGVRVVYISALACLGVACRYWIAKGLIAVGAAAASDDGLAAVVASHLIPNMLGSFLMGALTSKSKIEVDLLTGLTTGFCGSLTTFSGVNYVASYSMWSPLAHNRAPHILRGLLALILPQLASHSTFLIGRALAQRRNASSWQYELQHYSSRAAHGHVTNFDFVSVQTNTATVSPSRNTLPPASTTTVSSGVQPWTHSKSAVFSSVVLVIVIAGLGVWATVNDDDDISDGRVALLSCALAPLGALTRYSLGRQFNPVWPSFPLGTLAANCLGSLMLAIVFVLTHKRHGEPAVFQPVDQDIMTSIAIGIAGSLSTVSSFINELVTLSHHPSLQAPYYAARYCLCTLAISQLLSAAVLIPYLCTNY